ncbi:MAG: 30S ribosomal protein S15 [Candidatus Aenigmarchaeota archaeon]|nr:30S ribosomal protein S15 [Candidatus Aenigmarchaeota archaeon]MCK5322016.1 30S ribosomal protein S15 [Candidatus Aenigmarchaeota archaeon]
MARMYARRKGKASSTKPEDKKNPKWVSYKGKEIEKLVVKLSKEGNGTAMIGTALRDVYGIPSVRSATGKKIDTILKENKIVGEYPEPLFNLLKQAVNMHRHLKENKKDTQSIRSVTIVESKVRRLGKYYKKKGVLPAEWKYKLEEAKLIVQ